MTAEMLIGYLCAAPHDFEICSGYGRCQQHGEREYKQREYAR